MSASRGLALGPWQIQGRVPHRSESATPTSTGTVQAGLALSPIFGTGMPRMGGFPWDPGPEKPSGIYMADGTIALVNTTGLNQEPERIPPQVPVMGPSMNGYAWGGMPDGGRPSSKIPNPWGGRRRKKKLL